MSVRSARSRSASGTTRSTANSAGRCGSRYTISTRTVTGMSWQLRASQAGYSFDLLTGEASRRTYLLDDILPADGRWQRCYPAPALRSGYRAGDLEYRADQVRARLQR